MTTGLPGGLDWSWYPLDGHYKDLPQVLSIVRSANWKDIILPFLIEDIMVSKLNRNFWTSYNISIFSSRSIIQIFITMHTCFPLNKKQLTVQHAIFCIHFAIHFIRWRVFDYAYLPLPIRLESASNENNLNVVIIIEISKSNVTFETNTV